MRILEELWYGNIEPTEYGIIPEMIHGKMMVFILDMELLRKLHRSDAHTCSWG